MLNVQILTSVHPEGHETNMPPRKFLIGESLLTSLFTFSSLAYDLPHRSRGRIYKLNAKVERPDLVERFVQFSALCKQN